MKIYIAAPYSMKDTIADRTIDLQCGGIKVVSDWHKEPYAPTIQLIDISPKEHQEYAARDVSQCMVADVLVYHTDPTGTIVRAGRHVEFGIAIARGIPVYVVGLEFENLFHYLPQVRHFGTWSEVVVALLELDAASTA